jgi:hypothetical protein
METQGSITVGAHKPAANQRKANRERKLALLQDVLKLIFLYKTIPILFIKIRAELFLY